MNTNDLKYLIRPISSCTVQIIILHLKSDVHFCGIFSKTDDKNYTFEIASVHGHDRHAIDHGSRKSGFIWIKNPVDASEFADLLTNIDGYKEMTDEQIEDIIENHVENYEDILSFYENSTNKLQLFLSI